MAAKYNRVSAFILALLMLFSVDINVYAAEKADLEDLDSIKGSIYEEIIVSQKDKGKYSEYVEKYKDAAQPIQKIHLTSENASEFSEHVSLINSPVTQKDVIGFAESGSCTFTADVPETGLYSINIDYHYTALTENDALISLLIDGGSPYDEASDMSLARVWEEEGRGKQDKLGNDMRAKPVQKLKASNTDLLNTAGFSRTLLFYFEQGEHHITAELNGGDIALAALTLYNNEAKKYDEYQKDLKLFPTVQECTVQGEDIDLKSDSSIGSDTDRTGPATVPSDPVKLRYNILSGSKWKTPGQTVTYNFNIKESGRYKIGLRYLQDMVPGMFVTRRFLLDGELLFSELDEVKFNYSDSWKYTEIGGDEPYEFDFTKGDHTLTIEVVAGEAGELQREIENIVFAMNYLYRKIIFVTGTSPDTMRDYYLEEQIPMLVPTFKELSGRLKEVAKNAENMSGQKGGQVNALLSAAYQLDTFVNDPYYIQNRLASYKSNISAISSLISTFQEGPLSIDYINITGADTPAPKTEAGLISKIIYSVKAFIGSFFNSYNIVSDETSENSHKSIRAWFNGGREQAEIIKSLIDSDFAIEHDTDVNLQLVQIPLSQAILAGRAPDVVLNVSRGQPVNLAARGALKELSQFDGFDALKEQFNQDGFLPYTYKDGVYGIPVTLDYHVMFYRKDILEELNVKVPETWDDIYDLIPIVQRNNMIIGLPYTIMSTTASIDAGIGAKDIFTTLVLQNGGSIYTPDLSAVDFDSSVVVDVFKEWTDFYKKYQLELQYDFYNRFRTGEIPVGIQAYSVFNMLESAAPEIKGLWGMTLIPGKRQADGSINRMEAASGTAAVMLNQNGNDEASFDLLNWWCGEQTQAEYGIRLEQLMGKAARHNPANNGAFKRLPWSKSELDTLISQRNFVVEIPEVLGGYYTSRGIDNAFRSTVLSGTNGQATKNYREALSEQTVIINAELKRKHLEFE